VYSIVEGKLCFAKGASRNKPPLFHWVNYPFRKLEWA